MRGEQLYRVDNKGFPTNYIIAYFEGDTIVSEIDDDIIKAIIPQNLIRPKWDGLNWVEDMSQEEIDELYKTQKREPTENDILKAQNKALTDRLEFVEDLIAEMAMMIYD